MNGPPVFHLTRRAARDLREIYRYSQREWGEETANRYLADLYEAMGGAAAQPEKGQLRQHRAAPFLMIAAGRHFVVYDRIPDGIVILTVLHQVRDVEGMIADMSPAFLAEIAALKSGSPME